MRVHCADRRRSVGIPGRPDSRPKPIATVFLFLIFFPVLARPNVQTPSEPCKFVTAADLSDPKAPRFESYAAAPEDKIASPKLDLSSNPIAKRYQTVLRRELHHRANFAGHYRLAIWGCGSSCAMFAVIDLKTGQIITVEGLNSVGGNHLAADDFLPDTESGSWGFRFGTGSKLLVLVGTLDEDESREGAFYFVLQNEKLVPIHSTVVKKNCENVKK
jgi:hypothetical protein